MEKEQVEDEKNRRMSEPERTKCLTNISEIESKFSDPDDVSSHFVLERNFHAPAKILRGLLFSNKHRKNTTLLKPESIETLVSVVYEKGSLLVTRIRLSVHVVSGTQLT